MKRVEVRLASVRVLQLSFLILLLLWLEHEAQGFVILNNHDF